MRWISSRVAPGVTLLRVLNEETPRFENFWPIPRGTSYNFYVVEGSEGVALIDGADERASDAFWEALESVVDPREITHVVLQHSEPDHSGTIPSVLERAEGAVLLGTEQAIRIGSPLAGLPADRFTPAGGELDLGGRTLRFTPIPMVHWPDTMMTLLAEEGVLFTSDLFGSHGASEVVFYEDSPGDFELRDYYASILMAYSKMVARALDRVSEISPRMLAPSHGALFRDPGSVLPLYERWSRWRPLRRALVVLGSQYGRTARLAEAAAEGMEGAGLEVSVLDTAEADPDDLLAETLEAAAILVATSTHNGRPFPGVSFYLGLLEAYRPENKVAAVVGCHGWSGGGVRTARKRLESIGLEVVGELSVVGSPTPEDLERARELGAELGRRGLLLAE